MKEQDFNFFVSFGKKALLAAAHLPLIIGLFWAVGLCVCRPVCAVILVFAAVLIIGFKARFQTAFPLRGALSVTVLATIIGFIFLPAPSDMSWAKPWERGPLATVTDDTLHLRNIRDFEFYTTKAYDVRYLEEDFDLQKLCGVHLIESRRRAVLPECDLLLSFVFRDGRTLVFGPELRLPAKEQLNETQAFYKGYGLLYVFGTEEDMLRLRTNTKHEYLSFHTLRATQQQAQNMLLDCIRISVESLQDNEAYPPFEGQYDGAMQGILRRFHPQLPYTLNGKVASKLFKAELLASRDGETWETYRRRCAVGFDIADNRKAYSAEIRRIAGAPTLPATPAERAVQEESRATRPMREIMQDAYIPEPDEPQTEGEGAESGKNATTNEDQPNKVTKKSVFSQETRFTTGKGKALAEKIPEPGERLTVDTRDYSDEEYNSDETEGTDVTSTNRANTILEPKERMLAEAQAAAAAAEQKEKERKAAAEGRFKRKNAEGEAEDVPAVDYDQMLLGRKSAGIKIIEKEKPAEEAHPLDPYKRRNPFEEEKKKKAPAAEETDDLTAKPKPLHL